jgi:AcrR family transcriptional regulator
VKKTDPETRERLLEAGRRLFAQRGFKRVTVREVCRAARANVAAVSYHFGDKLGLYREVLQGAVAAMRSTNDAARDAGRGQPADEELRRYVEVFLQRVLHPGSGAIHQIITREMNEPTPLLDVLVEEGVRPRVDYLSGVIARMIGCDPRDERVLRCVASVQSQAVAYFPNPISQRLGFAIDPTPEQIGKAAEHIATFSIAGIRAVGRR